MVTKVFTLAIIGGTFVPHPGTTVSMLIIREEIARIWDKMGTQKVDMEISQEDYQY